MDSDVFRQLLHGNADMLVMKVLDEEPMHGYAVRKTLWERSNGLLSLSFGRLYPLLHSLEEKELIRGKDVRRGEVRVVRQYRLTAAGRKELRLRRMVWKQFSSAIGAIMQA